MQWLLDEREAIGMVKEKALEPKKTFAPSNH